MKTLAGKWVLLGVSGGIAAYRACELARLLIKDGATVQAVLTEAASRFVGPLTFQSLTGRPVEVGGGGTLSVSGMAHIDFGQQADLIAVAPATANTLAKIAHGLADNLLTSTILASRCPLVLAPAMNTRMWDNSATQDNLARLRSFSRVTLVGPDAGLLACGETGQGRMAEPEVILEAIRAGVSKKDLVGKRIVVTAGPTREFWDPVRYLTNRSSGRMGYGLAAAACHRGAEVVLISGPCSLRPPWGVRHVPVVSAQQMSQAVFAEVPQADAVLMAAAVADFRPREVVSQKLKKGQGNLAFELEPTQDILASLGAQAHTCLLVGFAAETGNPVESAKKKLKSKQLDLVVANDVSRPDAGFDVETNLVHLVTAWEVEELPLMSKAEASAQILDRVVIMLQSQGKKI